MAQNDLLIRISGDTKGFAMAMKSVNAELVSAEKVAAQTSGSFGRLGSAVGGMGGALAGALSVGAIAGFVKSAVEARAQMDSLERGLTAVMGSGAGAARELGNLKEVAKLPGLGFQEAVRGSINLQAAGFSADTARRALMGFGNALATVGKGKVELDGVITALTQISAKGKVSAEEINQLAERLPQIREIMRGAFGTADTEALQKMGISSQQFIEKIIAELEKLPKATAGIQNDLENFRDEWNQIMSEIGVAVAPVAIKVTSGFLEAVKGIRDAMALVYLELDKAKDYASRWLKEAGPLWQSVAATVRLMNNPLLALGGGVGGGGSAAPPPRSSAPKFEDSAIVRMTKSLEDQAKAAHGAAAAHKELALAMQGPITEAEAYAREIAKIEQSEYDAYFRKIAEGMREIAAGAKTASIETERYNRILSQMQPSFYPMTEGAMNDEQSIRRANDALKQIKILYGDVAMESEKSEQKQSAVMREVSTVMTDLSRGIANAIVEWKGFGEVFKNVAKEIAVAMLRYIIQGAFAQLGKAIMSSIGDLGKLGKVMSGIFGSASSAGASAASGAASAGSGSAGAASSAASGIMGTIGAVASVGSLISGVIGNFQNARQEGTLNAIEWNTRKTSLHAQDTLLKINEGIPGFGAVQQRIVEVRDLLVGWNDSVLRGVAGAGGGGVTVNFTGAWIGYRDMDAFVDDLVRRIKSKL